MDAGLSGRSPSQIPEEVCLLLIHSSALASELRYLSGSNYSLPANKPLLNVDLRGLEPLTSAMRGRSKGFAAVHYRSKNRLNKPNPRIVSPRMFAIVRAGCRQIVVSCISKSWASKETLFIDRQVYSTPVHVVLEGSVQEARERMSGRLPDWFYAGSCKQTSENSPSRHFGE